MTKRPGSTVVSMPGSRHAWWYDNCPKHGKQQHLSILGGKCVLCAKDDETKEWVMFTKRTNDPKLTWLEKELTKSEIPHRRNGESFHAPILEVPKDRLDDAWAILDAVDDIPDDDERFK
jgi:hypothetical protein